ncbi:MAG TPA: hypothetical protein VGB34_09440 [Candidatus Limnocylindria bacterium]
MIIRNRGPRSILMALALVSSLFTAAPAQASTAWNLGDLFAGIADGQYNVYDNAGTFKETISDGQGGFTTGCAFNPTLDKLYTTNFSAGNVVVYNDPSPHAIAQTIDTAAQGGAAPESIVFAANGDFYVGHADGDRDIQRYNAAGAYQQSYDVATDARGSDWIELAADQDTIYYTSEGRLVMRYDVSTSTQLADFATLPDSGAAFALRLLPPGDGTGGLLVADSGDVKRLDGGGAVVQTYDVTGEDAWFSLNLDPNGTSFWAGDFLTQNFYRFNIASGATEIGPINSGGILFGLCLKGEPTAAVPEICGDGIDNDGDGLIDEGCQPSTETSASGTKYYDANANGQLDVGEAGLADWPIDYDDGTTSASVLTDAAGNFAVNLDPGDYTFAEGQAGSPWFQTGNSVDQSGGTADVTLNPDMTYSVSFDAGETATGLNFGNLCVGGGGGRTIGFWGNKNGQALIGPDDLALLSGLNLVNENGSPFDPTSAAQVRNWLRNANANNMAYMLSAQLAAMALNVHNGFVQGSALVYAPDTTSANAAGFATVSALMAEANAELGLHPIALSGHPWRDYQKALKDALDDANNDLTFVQADASTCPAPFAEASFDLFADGSVSCVGADDTSREAGSVTFVESTGQVLFSVSLDGAAPNASYTLAISEEPTCANAVFFPDAITTDVNGDGSFSGSFAKAAGTYNLLVNLVTSPVPSDPTNREIATVDTTVVVH